MNDLKLLSSGWSGLLNPDITQSTVGKFDTMEPLSMSSGIFASLSKTKTVISLLDGIKEKPSGACKLVLEVRNISGLLQSLESLREERQDEAGWPEIWVPLISQEGPIDHLTVALEEVARKLPSVEDSQRTERQIQWSFPEGELQHTLRILERVKSLISLALTDVKFHNALRWLSPLDFRLKQQDSLSVRLEGTCLWFLESPQFRSWVSNTPSVLWCPGPPGSGKTIITSIVVDYLTNTYKNSNIGIAYVYCNLREQVHQTATNLVASLLQQLLRKNFKKNSITANRFLSIYRQHIFRHTHPSLKELTTLLVEQVSVNDRTFIVIDALNECSEANGTREQILCVLQHLEAPDRKASLLFTSRSLPSLEAEFDGIARLKIAADTSDIRRLVQNHIQQDQNLSRFIDRSPSVQELVIQTLIERSQGIFLLASLTMHLISQTFYGGRALLTSLQRLPSNLSDLYSEIMLRIEKSSPSARNLAHEILFWVSHTYRPLTVKELQCALALKPGDSEINPKAIVDESDILVVCRALVRVERPSNIIRLVHDTAQQYFETTRNFHFLLTQASIATKCLTCLSLNASRAGPCISDGELEHRLASIPLLHYAAKYWGRHMRHRPAAETITAALDLLRNENALASAVQIMHLSSVLYPAYSQKYPQRVSGLQLAAYLDLDVLVRELLAYGADLEVGSDYYGRPLQAAATGGSLNVCRLLIKEGVDVNAQGGRFNTALQAAAFAGHTSVALFLLESNAEVNAQGGLCGTSLQAASIGGHVLIVRELLKKDAAVNPWIIGGRTALHTAAMLGHLEIVQVLLLNEAEVDARDRDHGRTALCWAAESEHNDTIQLLLHHHASINASDHQNSTALHLALERHHQPTVQLLLNSGARFDVVDASNRTQIQIALASIDKINSIEFELDESLSRKLERGSQAEVSVFRRKAEFQIHKAKFELVIRKAFSMENEYAEDVQRNLMREREALQNLNHPNVVKFLKYEEDEDHNQAFLYTEYCDGGSLSKYISFRKTPQALNVHEAWSITYDLAAALAYCHHGLQLDETGSFSLKQKWQTILHRDIKPANGAERGVSVAKLCDMGWAKVWSDPAGYHTRHVGSLKYMPKEVRDGGTWTPKGDIHSLGATLRDLKRDFEDLEFDDVTSRCIDNNPSRRPSSFTMLELAAKRLTQIANQPFQDQLLPNNYGESNYLFQAVLETMDRLFTTYRAVESHRIKEVATRLKSLIRDWDKGETDLLNALNLRESPHLALILGDLESAKRLIRLGHKDSEGLWDTCGFTPLHIACREAFNDVVDCWIDHNYDVDAQDDKGRTALHWAIFAGSLMLCKKLLKANADTELPDDEGSTALHRAAKIEDIGFLLALLEKGASIKVQNKESETALHRAAANGREEAVRILLQKGADRSAVDKNGYIPEQLAARCGFQALADFLGMNSQEHGSRLTGHS